MALSIFKKVRSYLVLVAAVVVSFLIVQNATRSVQVLVAARDLPENTVITENATGVASVPAGGLFPGMVRAEEARTILGSITRSYIPAGYPVSRPYLQGPTGSEGFGLSSRIVDPRNVLFPVPAPKERVAGSGKLVAGEYVNVYLVWSDPESRPAAGSGKGAGDRAALYLQHQRVFDYDGKQLTIEVPKTTAAVLAYATRVGEIIVAPSRVDEVLLPDGAATADIGALRAMSSKPITDTAQAKDPPGASRDSGGSKP